MDMQTGDGLCGDLVAKTPTLIPIALGGLTSALVGLFLFR